MRDRTPDDGPERLVTTGVEQLRSHDPVLYELLSREQRRQQNVLAMIASSGMAEPSVLVCEGMATTNVTAEGYPHERWHAGCEIVDTIEEVAVERAKALFGARYANVQPHSGSSANSILMTALLDPGDTILALGLAAGGHITHGAENTFSGRYFNAVAYGVDEQGFLDYDEIRRLALEHRPRLILCGASAYPRIIDFERFRSIADEVSAHLLADISHIAGLVAAGQHPSPIDHCHFTTSSTYKQLYGPRGGVILSGRDCDARAPRGGGTLADLAQRAVFPAFQSTPNLSAIAAKARAFAIAATPGFRALAKRIVVTGQALAGRLLDRGYRVVTGGTDNHMIVVDVLASRYFTGLVAERSLESCDIITNKQWLPRDPKGQETTSGLRLGTNTLALRGLGPREMELCAELIDRVLSAVRSNQDTEWQLDDGVRDEVRSAVRELCTRFPVPHYPLPAASRSGCDR
jgi:glycine hydroxymethyltransferase